MLPIMVALLCVTSTYGAKVSFTHKSPVPGPDDAFNLVGAKKESANVKEGDNDATYIADDRPPQGQTFSTGTNTAGYQLRSITLREVTFDTFALVPDLTYAVRITQSIDGKITVLASETAEVSADASGNVQTLGDGNQMGYGSGTYITFTFDKPVALKPNSTYGFDVSGGTDRHYWQWDGTLKDAYPGGSAYSVLSNGKFVSRTGDHVFVAGMTAAKESDRSKVSSASGEKHASTPVANKDSSSK